MFAGAPHAATQLRQMVYYHLDNNLTQNALFIAGRLHALEPKNPDAVHLLALCHFRLGQLKAAYDYSKEKALKGAHLGCAYVFAQACLGLERYQDGITALDRARASWSTKRHLGKHSECSRRHVPDAAAVNCLLGKLLRAQGKGEKSAEAYADALRLNPFMWDAFTDLCNSGATLAIQNIFKPTPEMLQMLVTEDTENVLPAQMNRAAISTPGGDPFMAATSRNAGDPGLNHGSGTNLLSRLNGSSATTAPSRTMDWDTPDARNDNIEEDEPIREIPAPDPRGPPQAPMRKTRTLPTFNQPSMEAPKMRSITSRNRIKSSSDPQNDGVSGSSLASSHKRTVSGQTAHSTSSVNSDPSAPQRRSVRLFNQIRPSSSRSATSSLREAEAKDRSSRELNKTTSSAFRARGTESTVGRVVSGNRKPNFQDRDVKGTERPPSVTGRAFTKTNRQVHPHVETGHETEGLRWLLELFTKLATGYFYLSRYQSEDALQVLYAIPPAQRETPWVLAQIAKAFYQGHKYTEAEEIFSKINKLAPSRMEDMEVYSTVLWHLKRSIDLSYLAHTLVDADRYSPQAWCALGNSFSLQREHNQAIKCFQRATQLDPHFAYAWTLQGLEHIENEEFDKAQWSYRKAVSCDPRHYQAWYGLAQSFERLSKYEVAEKHYRSALAINPRNAILMVCIGAVSRFPSRLT